MGQHWYDSTGKPCHWMEGANGVQRDTTLRDARKLNLYPSVTTILGTVDKPALTNWKMKQVSQACFNDESAWDMDSYDDYHKVMMGMAFEKSTDAMDRGSEIHNCLEALIRDDPRNDFAGDIQEIARLAVLEVLRYCKEHRQNFTAEATVVGDGYGGMIDLHNDNFCIDWKTKDLTDDQVAKTKVVGGISRNTYLAWPEMSMQLAAYDQALENYGCIAGRRCINVFIDRTEPGKIVIHEWTDEEIGLAWKKFQLLVKYWQLDKNYFPTGDDQ